MVDYRELTVSLRPARMAVLFREAEDWLTSAVRMLENFSRVWGGRGHVLVPYADEEIAEEFWPVLERHDPDRVAFYQPTLLGWKLADPAAFDSWVSEQTELAVRQEGVSEEEARAWLTSDDSLKRRLSDWSPPPRLIGSLCQNLGLFPEDVEGPLPAILPDDKPDREVVDMAALPGLPLPLIVLRTEDLDPRLALMLSMRVGGLSPSYGGILLGRPSAVREVQASSEDLPALLGLCWTGSADASWAARRALPTLAGLPPERYDTISQEFDARTPLGATTLGCDLFHVGPPSRRQRSYTVIVGNSPSDFCLALALDRLYGRTAWVPLDLLTEPGELSDLVRGSLAEHLLRVVEYGYTRPESGRLLMSSSSLRVEDLNPLRELLVKEAEHDGALVGRLETVEPQDLPLPDPARLYLRDHVAVERVEPFLGGELAGGLETPVPLEVESPSERLTWYVDVSIAALRLPPRSCLNGLVVGGRDFEREGVRTSSGGVTFFSEGPFFVPARGRYRRAIARPRLRIPEPATVFRSLLEQAGLRGEPSAAGQFLSATIELWGGLEKLAQDFRDRHTYGLLEAYLSTEPSGRAPGIYLQDLRRRYLGFAEAAEASRLTDAELRTLLDRYVQRDILRRGLVLRCRRCRFAGWYALEELGQSFRCLRCSTEQLVVQEAWKDPLREPQWYYQLDEVVFQAIGHNARASVLALGHLRGESRTFLFTTDMEVWADEHLVAEVDLWAVCDGAIVVGEAKTTDRLESSRTKETKKARGLVRTAREVTAHEIVLATTAESWRQETQEIMRSAVPARRPRVRFLADLSGG